MSPFPEALNLCVEYVDRNVREGRGEKVALLYGDESYTYRQVLNEVCRAANLLEELGVQPEQRVLLALSDHPEFVFFWFAAVRMGATVSAISPDSKPEELAYYLEYTRSRALVAESGVLGKLPANPRHLRAVIACRGPASGGAVRWEEARARLSPDHTPYDSLADDVCVLLYTGGSTGFPKASVHRHIDFLFSTHAYGLPILGLREDDVSVAISKLFFGYALGNNLLFPFRAGATVALFPDKSTPERVLDEISRRRATLLTSVPTLISQMAAMEIPAGRWDWSSLRITTSAGEALPEEIQRRYQARFGHEVLDGIGAAETFHVYITNRPGDVVPGSLGRVVEGYEARIRDEEGRDLPHGELGSLWIRGESVALGYFRRTEATRQSFRGPWFVSADKFRCDEEGRFWYGGRTDDLLKVGGRFLAPLEVENAMLAHPSVLEVAVVGYEDEEGLTKPRAFVVPRPGHTPSDALAAELQTLVKSRLQPWKYPRQIVFRDSLPKSDRGKILKRLLRDQDSAEA